MSQTSYGDTPSCNCALCQKIREIKYAKGFWCDPRRGFSETEEDFLKRVPSGFTWWPKDHIYYFEAEPEGP